MSTGVRRSRAIVVLLTAAFAVLALALLAVTDARDETPLTGDEQHYMVIAKGLVEHRTLDQTEPYRTEFADREFAEWSDANAGFPHVETHLARGSNFSLHLPGLGVLLALPYAVGGVVGARLVLVLVAAAVVPLAWSIAASFTGDRRVRTVSVVVTTFSPLLLIAAGQVYPDVVGGTTLLAFLATRFARDRRWRSAPGPAPHSAIDVAGCALAALAPWFHLRFALAATVGVVAATAIDRRRATPRWWVLLIPLAASGVAEILVNLGMYGRITGPHATASGVVEAGRAALMVGGGLYLDQFQGLFFVAPLYVVGVVTLGRFLRTIGPTAAVALAMHLGLVLPAALHPVLYGGLSFPGRFAWSGAIVAIPMVLFGVVTLIERARRLAWVVLGGVMALHVIQLGRWAFGDVERYNALDRFPSTYPAQFPVLSDVAPKLFDPAWAFRYGPNLVAGVTLVGLIVVSIVYARRRGLWRAAGAVLGLGVVATLAIGRIGGVPTHPVSIDAGPLPSETGVAIGGSKVAVGGEDRAGDLSSGPYTELGPGDYRISFEYTADVVDGPIAGYWALVLQPETTPRATGNLDPAPTVRRVPVEFSIDEGDGVRLVDLDLAWLGEGSIALERVILEELGVD